MLQNMKERTWQQPCSGFGKKRGEGQRGAIGKRLNIEVSQEKRVNVEQNPWRHLRQLIFCSVLDGVLCGKQQFSRTCCSVWVAVSFIVVREHPSDFFLLSKTNIKFYFILGTVTMC